MPQSTFRSGFAKALICTNRLDWPLKANVSWLLIIVFYLIKKIEAGINTRVHWVDDSGGKGKEHSEPKWKLITNHPARKTFITNSIVLGMNTKTIRDITGHKKDSVFNKYVTDLRGV